MTSTPFNVGLTDEPRLSSRVLRPPGGGHTDIFGGEPEPQRGRRQFPGARAGQGDEPARTTNGTAAPAQNGQTTPDAAPQAAPATTPVEIPKTEPLKVEPPTAEAPKVDPPKAEAPKMDPPKVEPAKRVRVPPGGFSSGLW